MNNETVRAAAALAGRLLLAALFLLEGWSKIRGYGPAVAYMERFSVPALLLPAAIAIELGGGLLLAAVMFHVNFADRNQLLHFEKDLAIAGGLLAFFAFGPGRYAVDGRP